MSSEKNIGDLEVRFNIPLAVTFASVAALLIAFFILFEQWREELIFASSIAAGAGTLYAAYFVSKTLQVQVHRDKVNKSMEFLNRFNNKELLDVRTFIKEEINSNNTPVEKLYEELNRANQEKLKNSVTLIFNEIEEISISIQKGITDEETICLALYAVVPELFGKFKYYIDATRSNGSGINSTDEGDLRDHNEKEKDKLVYCEFEKMANGWKNGKSFITDKKITWFDTI